MNSFLHSRFFLSDTPMSPALGSITNEGTVLHHALICTGYYTTGISVAAALTCSFYFLEWAVVTPLEHYEHDLGEERRRKCLVFAPRVD